ncbi:MAG: hypothetical protein ACREQ5_02750 [Candidatus Dormibacteria bacterium]
MARGFLDEELSDDDGLDIDSAPIRKLFNDPAKPDRKTPEAGPWTTMLIGDCRVISRRSEYAVIEHGRKAGKKFSFRYSVKHRSTTFVYRDA